jgi:phosphoglycerate dehydrogenase-like enzyme
VVATSHVGFVTRETYEIFYGDTVKNIVAWLDEGPR